MNKGLMFTKSVASVYVNHTVPVQVLNVSDKHVNIGRNCVIAKFEQFGYDDRISCLDDGNDANILCANISEGCEQNAHMGGVSGDSMHEFMSHFSMNSDLDQSKTSIVLSHLGLAFVLMLRPFFPELVMSTDLLSFEHPSVVLFGLQSLLWNNKDVFVTKDSPDIGVTRVLQHTIHLKPNAISKHHKPYRLPPDKREVLRHQLGRVIASRNHCTC